MLLTEWDTEEAKMVWREEGFEEGREKGRILSVTRVNLFILDACALLAVLAIV